MSQFKPYWARKLRSRGALRALGWLAVRLVPCVVLVVALDSMRGPEWARFVVCAAFTLEGIAGFYRGQAKGEADGIEIGIACERSGCEPINRRKKARSTAGLDEHATYWAVR